MSKYYYKKAFDSLACFQAPITPDLCRKITSCCTFFETKEQHPSALNSPYLGVVPMYFTKNDVAMLFTIVGVEIHEVELIALESGVTEDDWVVSNDPYNLTVIYLIHRVLTESKLNDELKQSTSLALLKLLHYKFFTSVVNKSYPYGADESTMAYVINTMSKKYDIARIESWGALIAERCKQVLDPSSIHYKTFIEFEDDVAIILILSDCQTNLRQKLVRVNQLYYEAKESHNKISTYSSIDSIDGEKILAQTTEVFDSMNASMQQQILLPSRFLDFELIEVLTSKYREVSSEIFRNVLTKFCEIVQTQRTDRTFKKRIKTTDPKTGDKVEVIASLSELVTLFLQKTYRYCMRSKDVDITSKKSILVKVLNIYTSSQLVDEDIIQIKRSFVYTVTKMEVSKRIATISAIATCLILYILLRSFDYIGASPQATSSKLQASIT